MVKKYLEKNKNGFTLIELLITISILAILVAIAVPVYIGQQKKAAMTEAISNLQQLRLLEEQFFAENARYAPDVDNSVATPETAFYDVTRDVVPILPDSIRAAANLPGFRPGNARDLNYDYSITSPDPATPAVRSFVAYARPKAGRIVRGTAPFWINDRNQNNF